MLSVSLIEIISSLSDAATGGPCTTTMAPADDPDINEHGPNQ